MAVFVIAKLKERYHTFHHPKDKDPADENSSSECGGTSSKKPMRDSRNYESNLVSLKYSQLTKSVSINHVLVYYYKISRLNVSVRKSITLNNLSTAEKIELMEKLWDDLSSSPDYDPPKWHGDELAQRKKAVKEGEVTNTDWEKAKEEIRKDIS